jgi:hypothetical protein
VFDVNYMHLAHYSVQKSGLYEAVNFLIKWEIISLSIRPMVCGPSYIE